MGGRRRDLVADGMAALLPIAAILIVVWPNLRGSSGLGTETAFDRYDPLFGDASVAPSRNADDSSPIIYDWPRDRRLIERVRGGHFDLWNPVPGNGTPLGPDPGGIFSPLRLVLYTAPFGSHTAFVLFRIFRLLVAALGGYLLARVSALSRSASVVVGITFGLSGGMVSQLPFATVGSVCWLPWICWAQIRIASRRTAISVVPHALTLAATFTGGHQPIVVAMVLGALAHAAGLIAVPSRWRDRGRVALLMAGGYGLGLLLAAPAILAFAELVVNGYSYKGTGISQAFQLGSIQMNRSLLFVAAVIPRTIDALRDGVGGASYPYILNFSCGVLPYLLAALAVVRRRWRLEWFLMLLLGIALCFAPPGTGWLGAVPFIRDIQGRYAWALCVLPVTVAAGFGVDALRAVGSKPGLLFVPIDPPAGRPSRRHNSLGAPVIGAMGVFALMALSTARLMWVQDPRIAAGVAALLDTSATQRLNAGVPLLGAAVALVIAAWLARRGWHGSRWLIAIAVCVEVAGIAVQHLRDPPSHQIREPDIHETAQLAADIEKAHTRVGGMSTVVVGLGGWREVRSLTPMAPLRYARFLEAAAGPISFTVFNLAANRSALTDLAAVGYLIVGRENVPSLENDPEVVRIADIKGVTVFRNRGALARARVVHRTIVVKSIDDAVALLTSLTAGAAHVAATPLATAVILESTSGAPPPLTLTGGAATPAEFIVDDADDLLLNVDAPEPGYLVVADTHYPGWKATVDGQDQPIYPANVGFRAVYVDRGKHVVAFRFRPASFRVGLACVLAGLFACAAILARFVVARRTKTPRGIRAP